MTDEILIQVANPPEEVNGVNWWRVFRPFSLLSRKYRNIKIRFNPGQLFPHDFIQADILFVYRPENPDHPGVITMAKELGCKIILDWDDNNLNVPVGHPVFRKFINSATAINQSVALADQVWCSTEGLLKAYKGANLDFLREVRRNLPYLSATGFGTPEFQVIPNAVLPSDLPERANGNTRLAMWRGSDLHRDDIELYRSQYDQILRNVSVFRWELYMPHWGKVDNSKAQIFYNPDYVPTHRWLNYIRSFRPSLIWKPLVPNTFNTEGKSNVAWIEATCAGGICLTNLAGTSPLWEHCAKGLPKMDEYYIHLWQKSAEAIREHYDLTAWNEVRYRQILKLMNG